MPTVPRCRIDDFFGAMDRKWTEILDTGKKNDCPIIIAGDLGRRPLNRGWPTWLLEWFIRKSLNFGVEIHLTPGQHDLPGHNIERWPESGIGVLHQAGALNVHAKEITQFDDIRIHWFPYGSGLDEDEVGMTTINIAVAHMMVIKGKPLWPGQEAPKAVGLLKKYPMYDLILTGDNHQQFVAKHEGRILVNPGSMMRTTADQVEHTPAVYLWYRDKNVVKPHYLRIEEDVIDRSHIDDDKEANEMMRSYVDTLKSNYDAGLSYEDNMEEHLKLNRVTKSISEKIWNSMSS